MKRIFIGWIGVALLGWAPAATASPLSQKLDPRLASALSASAEPVPVWVEFVDKGEQGPSDLRARLDRAERELTPETRARRIRANLSPIVDYLDLPLEARYVEALRLRGLAPYGFSRWLNGCCVRTSGAALSALGEMDCVRLLSPAQLAQRPAIEPVQAEPLPLSRPTGGTSANGTPAFYGQTYTQMLRLGVPAVHDSGYIGTGVTVAVFDEGFNYFSKHEATRTIDVADRTRDFVRGGAEVQDTLHSIWSHGQNTLSCVAGNAPGIYVGSGYGARFALARTEDNSSEKPIEMVNWLMAAEWADSLGADIISSSLGYLAFPDSAGGAFSLTPAMLDGHTALVTRAAEIAASKGILVVNSAGNYGPGATSIVAPADASGDSTLAVGAVDSAGVIVAFSSRGPTADGRIKPDVCAQGSRVLVASASGVATAYGRVSGTSFSCPLTAGLLACLLQARPAWSPMLVLRALKMSASRAGNPNSTYGWGSVDGLAALRWIPDTAGVPDSPRPLDFVLQSSNPMHAGEETATLRFSLPAGERSGRIAVYDVGGRRVRTVWAGSPSPGQLMQTTWDGRDGDGHALRSGLYFITFEAGGRHAVIRLATLR